MKANKVRDDLRGYTAIITRRQDNILKIKARILLWNVVAEQIPRGCVWNPRRPSFVEVGTLYPWATKGETKGVK